MSVNAASAASGISGGIVSSNAGKNEIDKDGFLQLLAAELQNQDPTNPQDSTQFVSEMAQYSALEQMQNLNQSMNSLLLNQQFEEGSIMIGKYAQVTQDDGSTVSGAVTGVKYLNGGVSVTINGKDYSMNNVTSLSSEESGASVL